jgi:hypothetical protein
VAEELVTLAEVKAYCGVTSTNADAILQPLLDAAATSFANYCGRSSFFSRAYTSLRDGNGSSRLVMSDFPVTDVVSVVVNGRPIPKAIGENHGYNFVRGGRLIFLRGYFFNAGYSTVEITYTAGFNDPDELYPIPPDLALAAKMYVAARFKERAGLGTSAKSLAGESVSYNDGGGSGSASAGIPAAAATILEKYINRVPGY